MSRPSTDSGPAAAAHDLVGELERRLGSRQARRRLRIEHEHEARLSRRGVNFLHGDSWYSLQSVIRTSLRLAGLYARGRRNAERVVVRENLVRSAALPPAFDGFTILHLSDPHVELNEGAMRRLGTLVEGLAYDLCVLTGDYRGKTAGPYGVTLECMARVRARLRGPVYGVLGNHDTIHMVPGLEAMGIRLLLNEGTAIERGGERIWLAGIDDAHFFRTDDIAKAAERIPMGEFSILLSHTPEIYRDAAEAGFDLMLSGHTHGGQICLPGSIPIVLDSDLPRRMGSGAWRYGKMAGYTSAGAGSGIVPVRLNCPPEITLHHLIRP